MIDAEHWRQHSTMAKQKQFFSRRAFLKTAHASAALAALPALQSCGGESGAPSAPPPEAPPKRPNILMFVVDDQRNDTLGCAGHPVIRTPHIDSLAAAGTLFRNAFVTTSICAASRASILTGLYERTHRYTFEAAPMSDALIGASYPALLRQAGYRTSFVGKFGVEVSASALLNMFDRFQPHGRTPYFTTLKDGTRIHETDLAAMRTIELLNETPTAQPFCISVSFNAVHAEDGDLDNLYPWPPSADGLYEGMAIAPPRLSDPAIFDALPGFLKNSFNRERFAWCCDSPEKYQRNMRAYFRMISGVDAAIGRILVELKRLGLDDNTVVIYTADNGYYMGDRGFAGKWSHYEQSIRVPMVIRDPRVPASARGRTETALALNVDLAPTVLQLAGLSPPAHTQGRSLVPLLSGQTDASRAREFLCEHLWNTPGIPRWEGVRGERYVYARYFSQAPVYEFLHDLDSDPDQLLNFAEDPSYRPVLESLRKRCAELTRAYEAVRI